MMLNMLKCKSARRYAAMALCFAGAPTASALETIRIGLPTKTYYPTIIAETALRQGLFAREGIERMPAREETMVGALAPA
jgi:hypothetical protein